MIRLGRKGYAMPAATGALVVVGVIVTSGFYMAQQELRIGVASQFAGYAVNLAQEGANEVMLRQTTALATMSMWDSQSFTGSTADGTWKVTAYKMSTRLFFLDATGTVTRGGDLWGGATRRLGVTTRYTSADMDPPAALTTQGSLTVGGSSAIVGFDSIPSGWNSMCDSTMLTNKTGIMIDDTTQIKTTGAKYSIDGSPEYDEDASMTTDSLLSFGDFDWDDLVTLAQIRIANGTTITQLNPDSVLVGGVYECDTSGARNWGDPINLGSACSTHFPIIYAEGSLSINANDYGQGILLVEDDLAVQGGFTFYGPVVVRGELSTAGTGGHFNGGVIAANVNLNTSSVLGNAVVSYSSCAIERAVLNNSALTRLRPIERRSWVDLSNVIEN